VIAAAEMSATPVELLLSQSRADPAVVVKLYPALSKQAYWVFVRTGSTGDLRTAEFLTYPSRGCYELPVFTSEKFHLFNQFKSESGAEAIHADGAALFRRLEGVLETGKLELAINPGWEHGIRLNRTMLLSALAVS